MRLMRRSSPRLAWDIGGWGESKAGSSPTNFLKYLLQMLQSVNLELIS